jgi:rRNA maturation endonuclease Nob1
MGKEKKPKLGIKTSRYYTKKCDKCSAEYPNWFTNCPNCGAAWDEAKEIQEIKGNFKKNIKIVVKITEEDFNEAINNVKLIFSADQGKNWYQVKMDIKMDYFIAEIAEIPVGSVIIYYIEVSLENDEVYIENNNGEYFYYKVGSSIEESEMIPPESETQLIKDNIKNSQTLPRDYNAELKTINKNLPENNSNLTIFGKPQTQIDPDLKVCPHCNAKIKKMWGICPLCGKKV